MKLPAVIFAAFATLATTSIAPQAQANSFSTGISITKLSLNHSEVTQNNLVQDVRLLRHRGSKSKRNSRRRNGFRIHRGTKNRVFTGSNTFNNSRLQDSRNFDAFAYRRFRGGVGGGLTGGFHH
jgi:hypothetical protein